MKGILVHAKHLQSYFNVNQKGAGYNVFIGPNVNIVKLKLAPLCITNGAADPFKFHF